MITLIIGVIIGALVMQGLYAAFLWLGFRRIWSRSVQALSGTPVPISVIVAARNEADRLPALLETLSRQTHPAYEVIIVNDASTDATLAIVEAVAAQDTRIRWIDAPVSDGPRKKSALTHGIAAARYELLAFTDADCRPPPTWLSRLAAWHTSFPGSVLVGYGPFERRPSVLNRLIRYETVRTALLTAAAVGLDRPYMAVGRNLSYPRSVFEHIEGFAHSRASISGDDDLLVQEVHRQGAAGVQYVADSEAFVPSEPVTGWQAWVRQKRRHASAGRFYGRGIQVHLGLYHLSSLIVWLGPLLAGGIGFGVLGVHLLIQAVVVGSAVRALREPKLLAWLPLLEAGYVAYTTLVAAFGVLRMPQRW